MAKVLDRDGLNHLIARLDERYGANSSAMTEDVVHAIWAGTYIHPEESESASSVSLEDAEARLNSNAHEPKTDRVLNYPGLVHLIPRLDLRYVRGGMPASSARRLTTGRYITLTGEASGYAAFDGSEDIEIATAVSRMTNTEIEEMLT